MVGVCHTVWQLRISRSLGGCQSGMGTRGTREPQPDHRAPKLW